jgi:uncharacterized protein (TIGR02466 family)
MEINHFFSSPVFILNDNEYEENIAALLEDIYEWQAEDDVELVRSNNGGWHSPADIFKRNQPGLKRVCKLMVSCFGLCTKEIAPEFKPEDMDMKGEGWVNVNPIHSFNVPHDHPGFTWSGVYYVSIPEKKDAKSRSGSIELLDPRTNTAAMATDIAGKSTYFSPKRTLNPKSGMILIFPSYLRHWVYPNEENQDRISIAFNFRYLPRHRSQ